MPTINTRKICNKHGFYNAIENPSCPKCKKQNDKTYDKGIRNKDRIKIYNSRRWKEIREVALLRDSFFCVMCKKEGNDVLASEVHHLKELADRPDLAYDLDNLESICHSHHMGLHH